VSALTRDQEDFVEVVTKDVWRLEQQVTGGELGDPEEFVDELFQARHGLLAVRTMAALSAAIYGRMATLASAGAALAAAGIVVTGMMTPKMRARLGRS
jgi:magnesium transporter